MRIVALPRATSFNQVVDIDVFHILWGENEKKQQRRKVLTVMEKHTRFEVDQPVKKEKAKIITRAINKYCAEYLVQKYQQRLPNRAWRPEDAF